MNKCISTACLSILLACAPQPGSAEEKPAGIQHDAEYDLLLAQHADRWAADDRSIDAKLAELREKNDGKPPNIIYILLDDLGFGEIGMPGMAVTRGYKTPNLDAMAREGLSLQRMYTEPSCTPTRVAMMTGRRPGRTGFGEAETTLTELEERVAELGDAVGDPAGFEPLAMAVRTESAVLFAHASSGNIEAAGTQLAGPVKTAFEGLRDAVAAERNEREAALLSANDFASKVGNVARFLVAFLLPLGAVLA